MKGVKWVEPGFNPLLWCPCERGGTVCIHGVFKKHLLACIIFAGATFSRVHESRMMYDCFSFGTLVILLVFILSTSLAHMSVMVCHPKKMPSLRKLFEPPSLELCRADAMFFSCMQFQVICMTYIYIYIYIYISNAMHACTRSWAGLYVCMHVYIYIYVCISNI